MFSYILRKSVNQVPLSHNSDSTLCRALNKVLQMLRKRLGGFTQKPTHADNIGYGGTRELKGQSQFSSIKYLLPEQAHHSGSQDQSDDGQMVCRQTILLSLGY